MEGKLINKGTLNINEENLINAGFSRVLFYPINSWSIAYVLGEYTFVNGNTEYLWDWGKCTMILAKHESGAWGDYLQDPNGKSIKQMISMPQIFDYCNLHNIKMKSNGFKKHSKQTG